MVQALRDLDAHAGPCVNGTNHDVDVIPYCCEVRHSSVENDSILRRQKLTLSPEDMDLYRTVHPWQNLLDQPQSVQPIGPPGTIGEVSESQLAARLRLTGCRRRGKERRHMKGPKVRHLSHAPGHFGC